MSAADEDGVFDGAAELDVAGQRCGVRVRLAGHLSPIDGRYHWQGLVYGAPEDLAAGKAAQLWIGDRSAEARLVERIPSGQLMISGTGSPPYDLAAS
ncbi:MULTISPECIES: DUF4873 domain-containing protein [Mycobacteriaceae]|uniref:DUF4873 domain-containing protein n=1 Tax=Mycobacteriaceae TaxID=1762 RepID=UPI0007FE2D8C|nr:MULTISPECIES: DUF4873 domain-containing protein [Mycobacteriaceae]MCK0176963.1 DUF4873 domain-containing protein [Mycolicibacterium sp. F2034L]OBB62154.1 DUF4873 domain-containing protein [Mycobacterium sp. 852013-51886_SCH5428379]